MTDLINGRTPEEIKSAINACISSNICLRGECIYSETNCNIEKYVDLLAYIEHLESERGAAMAKQPKWISVEDRLPESHDEKADCFLVTDGTFIWMAYYACKEWQFAECTDSPYVIDWTEITHWMPLPEPPEED